MNKIFKWLFKKNVVEKYPFVTIGLIEFFNISQGVRMIKNHSSEDQSIMGWIAVTFALVLWTIYYKVIVPEQKIAYYSTVISIFINITIVCIALYFRI